MALMNLRMQPETGITPLPNAFIDFYLPEANPVYTVLYIYCFRHALQGTGSLSTLDAADTLGILESDVLNGWKYWEKAGLVHLSNETDSLEIHFLPVTSPVTSPTTSPATSKQENEETQEESNPPDPIRPVILESRPQYTVQELELYKNNSEEINRLFEGAEKTLGKLLSYNDLSALFGFYDWLRLPVDVIEELLSYCAGNGHRSMRYIEKAAIDWAENGINTVDAASEYIKTFNKDFHEILKAVGQSRRNPTKTEITYMKKWLQEYELPIILEACDKTVMQLGGPKFSYTDKIITGWKEKGIKSLEDIQAAEDSFYKEKQSQVKTTENKGKKTTKNRFANYSQREWDYAKLEKLEMEYLEKNSKE